MNAAGVPFPVEFFVQAHQDDWQLFLGNRAVDAVPTASKVVFIYTTAGDAGSTSNYWHARELAARASIDSMTPAGVWSCANQAINGHSIQRCAKGGVVSWDMRLPDGNGDGQGYPPLGASLARLRSGAISQLAAVDGSTTYTSWGDLVATFRSIVTLEEAGRTDPTVAIHAPEDTRRLNDGDHLDHLTTGDLVRDASAGRTWNSFWYIGYPSLYQPANLTTAEFQKKWKVIVAYDNVLKGDYGTLIGTGHTEEWAWRTIFRTEWSTGDPPPAPTTVPVAPSAMTVSTSGASGIQIAWTDNSSDEDGFRIERAPDVAGVPGSYAEIATVTANVTSYSSTDVVADTRYWFRVRAYNIVGPSAYSNEASGIVPTPAAPSALTATPFSATRIDLGWTDNSTDEAGFRIERAPDVSGAAGVYAEIATVGPNVSSYASAGLQGNTRYWFRVRAYNAVGSSAFSASASAQTPAPPPSAFPIEAYVIAHQDDWQLFMGDRTAASASADAKVVIVYTTAGDAGSTQLYWQTREAGANASVDSMTVPGTWSCASQTVNNHAIQRCSKANTVSYYFRLPDGNSAGQGYGSGSLELLRDGQIASLSALNGTATYTSWADLVSTVRALIVSETTGQTDANVAVHVTDWDPAANDGDHPDHMATGQLVRDASVSRAWNLFWYLGYPSLYQPVNLDAAQQAMKWRLIVAYDDVLKPNYGTIIGTSHAEEWSQRTVFRAQPSNGIVPPTAGPNAPTGLSAASFQGTRIDLSWQDNAGDEQGFRIDRAVDVSGSPGAYAQLATVAANATTFSNTGIATSTRYWYRVSAYNTLGNSATSNEASAILSVPAAPNALSATPVGAGRIDLAWSDNSGNDEQGFQVERAPDSGGAAGTYARIATVGANVTVYSNTGLAAGTTYWYRVRAYNPVGASAFTTSASATTLAPPNAPSGLTAAPYSGVRIDLAWTDNATNEQGFRVERAPDASGAPGTFAQVASVGANIQAYSSTGLANGTQYWYRVRAYNASGTSAYSANATATTLSPPAAPTNLQGSAASSVAIDLSWVDNASTETSYRVERAPDVSGAPGTFGSAVTLAANTTTYRSSGLAATTSYWYRVRAQNAVGNSPFAPAVRVSTLAFAPPTALTATPYVVGTTRNVDLVWTRGSELSVDIYRGSTRIAAARANDGGPFTDTPAASLGATLTYQVCAAGKTGSANCSPTATVTF
ncbi:MAG TPA: fibronectin type III domain-containing protein [Gemmatimonadaceae bacterium]|nr:fibronectin type III domain-containing protein [Gemmatimonadaceae bacterium]